VWPACDTLTDVCALSLAGDVETTGFWQLRASASTFDSSASDDTYVCLVRKRCHVRFRTVALNRPQDEHIYAKIETEHTCVHPRLARSLVSSELCQPAPEHTHHSQHF
jgi:hypothetical protein